MTRFLLVCYLFGFSFFAAAQKLDDDFGANGKVILDNLKANLYPRHFINDSVGNLYILGENLDFLNQPDADSLLYIIKLSPSGKLDSNFGANGIAVVSFNQRVTSSEIKVLSNGGIVVSGTLFNGVSNSLNPKANLDFLVALSQTGEIQRSFGDEGVLYTEDIFINGPSYTSFTTLEDQIFVSGTFNDSIVVVGLDSNGSRNPLFGDGGALAMQLDDVTEESRILASSDSVLYNISVGRNEQEDFVLKTIKINLPQGHVDSSFAINGVAESSSIDGGISNPPTQLNITAIDINLAQIYISFSRFRSGGTTEFFRMKLDIDGRIDTTLGSEGFLIIDAQESRAFASFENQILSGGTGNDKQILRLAKDTKDPIATFGIQGEFEVDFSETGLEFCNGILWPEEGIIFAMGWIFENNSFIPTLFKLNYPTLGVVEGSEGIVGANIFPNPAQNTLHLPNELSTQNLRLYNIQGQQFEVVQPSAGKLDVSHLTPGIYVLQARERIWRFVKE